MSGKNKRDTKSVSKRENRRGANTSRANADRMSAGTNKLLMTLAVVSLILGVVGYYYFTGIALAGDLKNQLIGYGSISVGVVLSVLFAFMSQTGRDFVLFFKEARIELRRVFWPSVGETRQMSILVVIVMAIVMVFLMIVDALLSWIITLIVG